MSTYAITDLNGKEIFETFYEMNCKKQTKKGLESKKGSREKVINCVLNGKDEIIILVGLLKRHSINE